MARTRAATYDAQREFILETAAAAFAELGFPSASMNDIARRCGVSKGLLYHYYTSKERLLFDVTEQYTRRLVALVEEAERRVRDPAKRLPELIRLFLEEYQTSQARHMVLLHDLRFLPDAERRLVVENQRRVIDSFAKAIRAAHGLPGNLPIVKPVTMMLFGMMNWTFTWLKPDTNEATPPSHSGPLPRGERGTRRTLRAGTISYAEYADLVAEVFAAGVAALARKRLRRTAVAAGS
jgi:AcrR family transcriptional regulator